nr:hypothetical protein [Tanacetum cinerariifolium]
KDKLLQEEQWAYLSTHPSKRLTSFCFDDDDDEDYTSAITPDEPVLSIEEPDNSLSMGDEHLDTILATESDEFMKSSVEDLIPIPSESEGIPDHMCDVPSHDNSPPLDISKDQFEDFSESNEEFSSTDDDSFSFDKIGYVEASPPDYELVSSKWAYLSTHPSKRLTSFCYDDDDEDYTSAITPDELVLSTEEPNNSLSMRDEHFDTISATKSDEFIKSGVETLIPIPSESEGIPEHVCDVPFHDNSPPLDVSKDQIKDFSESNKEFSLTDDDSFSINNIDYVEASPPGSELVSSEVMEIVIPEVGWIKASNDNPILFYDPIISGTPPNLTPSGESDSFLEVDAFLAVEDEPTSSQFLKSYLDPEGDVLLFEAFLSDDHSSDFKTKSSSTSLNSLLEETNNFDNSLPEFTTFSNDPFDAKYESDSSDDQSCSDEDVLEKIISKPLCEEEIIPMKSLRTHDSSLSISSKIDSLLDEFADELTILKLIPPGIDETDYDFEEDIHLIEKLLYDNFSPRPPKEFVSANSDAKIKSFFPSPILIKDSDSLMEEIDLFCTPDYPMPPGIEDKDYDSERDILIPKDLPSNNSLSFAEQESVHFDIPPFSRPPAKPPDGDTGILNIKMMGDIYYQKAFMHKLMITLASHQEKSPDLLSHRCGTVKKFNTHQVDAFLAIVDKSTSSQIPKSYLDPERDMLLFESFLNDDPSSESQTKSSSTFLNSLLEETNNFHNSLPECTTFSHVLCDAECESDSSDDQSPSDKDVLETIILKPLYEEEIIPMKSLHTHDSSLPISSKIDSLLDEFITPRVFGSLTTKTQKGQNQNKMEQKREAWRSQEKVKVVTVDRGRKTEENAKRMVKNARTVKKLLKFKERKKREGPELQIDERYKKGVISAKD